MGRHRDEKLQTIADSVVGRRCGHDAQVALGRCGDLIDCDAGVTFHSERDVGRWAYLLLEGDVALGHRGEQLAVASRGSWFPLHERSRGASGTSLTAVSSCQLLVFRSFETAVIDLRVFDVAH